MDLQKRLSLINNATDLSNNMPRSDVIKVSNACSMLFTTAEELIAYLNTVSLETHSFFINGENVQIKYVANKKTLVNLSFELIGINNTLYIKSLRVDCSKYELPTKGIMVTKEQKQRERRQRLVGSMGKEIVFRLK